MSGAEPRESDPGPDPEAGPECRQARERIRAFLHGGLGARRTAALRAHLAACPVCEQVYREGVQLMGRMARDRPEVGGRSSPERPVRRPRLAFGATRRGSRLRLLLMPALAILLLTQLDRIGERARPFALRSLEGAVQSERGLLDPTGGSLRLTGGDWCRTGPDACARLEGPDSRAELGPRTGLVIERARPDRLRLQGGTLTLSGTALLSCRAGVVEVLEGAATAELTEEGLTLHCLQGEVLALTSAGERRLAPGETIEIPSPTLRVGALPSGVH